MSCVSYNVLSYIQCTFKNVRFFNLLVGIKKMKPSEIHHVLFTKSRKFQVHLSWTLVYAAIGFLHHWMNTFYSHLYVKRGIPLLLLQARQLWVRERTPRASGTICLTSSFMWTWKDVYFCSSRPKYDVTWP